jgi:type IV pilus assembly protein PilE
MKRKSAGFTLIELMIAATIAAIISRIGFDIYKNYVARANRAIARTALLSLAAKEEQQILQNPTAPTYAVDFYALINIGTTGQSSYYIDQSGVPSASATGGSIYQISFSSVSTSAYTLQAVAQGVQATRDKTCTTLMISNTGLKQAKNSSGVAVTAANLPNCWDK